MSDLLLNEIPDNTLTPGDFYQIDTSRLDSGLPKPVNRVLIIGQRLTGGTVSATVLTPINVRDEARTFFGRGSMLARMAELYLLNDPEAELYCMAVDDAAGGVKATKTITLSGAVTAAGTLAIYIGGQVVKVPVAASQATTSIAAALSTAINAVLDISVVASVTGSVVTLTARHKGSLGNGIDVRRNYSRGDQTPPGLGVAFATGVTGSGDPDLTAAITAIGDKAFAAFIHPYPDSANLAVLEAALAVRASAMHQSDGMAFTASIDTLSNLQTLGGSRDSQFTIIIGARGLPEPSWEVAAAVSGPVMLSINHDPGDPFTGLVVQGLHKPTEDDALIRQERNYLLLAGVSTLDIDGAGNVVIERMITTYKTNALGYPSAGLRDVNALALIYYLRWSLRVRRALKFPRKKLGNNGGNYGPNANVMTPNDWRAEIWAIGKDWEFAGLIENYDQFKAEVSVRRDPNDQDSLISVLPPNLINQWLVNKGLIQPIL